MEPFPFCYSSSFPHAAQLFLRSSFVRTEALRNSHLRFKCFDLRLGKKPFIAELAEKPRGVRRENQIQHYWGRLGDGIGGRAGA
jgi:hypothetical protein